MPEVSERTAFASHDVAPTAWRPRMVTRCRSREQEQGAVQDEAGHLGPRLAHGLFAAATNCTPDGSVAGPEEGKQQQHQADEKEHVDQVPDCVDA
jgi:hypothetical protein